MVNDRQHSRIPNPITTAFQLVEGYQALLRETLGDSGLTQGDVAHVLEHLDDIGVDSQVLLSLNRSYALDERTFEDFCQDHLGGALFRTVYRSAPEQSRIDRLYRHQAEGIESIVSGVDTIVATGTGSGKTETFLFPLLAHCLKNPGAGLKALIIYPMNALANDQLRRLAKLVEAAREDGHDLSFGSFTGQTPKNPADAREKEIEVRTLCDGHVVYRDDMRSHPPDILITNYVMLERMLTRDADRAIFSGSGDRFRYVVLDELHTYRGNKAAHLRGLLRRFLHILSSRPVFIGTSATLADGGSLTQGARLDDGYLNRTLREDVDAFIKPLLDTDAYSLVLPQYAKLPLPATIHPVPHLDESVPLGWDLRFDEAEGLERLSRLTGRELTDWDLESDGDQLPLAHRALAENAFVVSLTTELQNRPLSFRELVNLLMPLAPKPGPDPVDLAKGYLSAIAFVNHFADGTALLDFRIHLFLKNLGGYLQSCVRCRRYHSGHQEVCNECGWPLFMVDRSDVHQALGKVSGRTLRRQLKPESDDPQMTFFLRLRLDRTADEGEREGALFFDETAPTTEEGIQLLHKDSGALRMVLHPEDKAAGLNELGIPLVSARKDHQYLLNLLTSILQSEDSDNQKLLGFIDNREHASRYVAILRDEFAAQYFLALLRLYRNALEMRSLPDAFCFVLKSLDESSIPAPERELVRELPSWLSRELSRAPRMGMASARGSLFVLAPPPALQESGLMDELSVVQRELLELFLSERAIDKRFLSSWLPELEGNAETKPSEDHAIKFQRYLISQHHGVALEGQASGSKRFTSIALSGRSRFYADFVQRHGEAAIREELEGLSDRGQSLGAPLLRYHFMEGEESRTHYYLKSDWVRLAPEESDCEDLYDVRRRHFLTAALHSSDVRAETRTKSEQGFQDGRINFLLATPTLEMGVDIGKLKSVLMVGIPPLPSNYAQRAGRAGRSRKGRYALVVSFCSDEDHHDRYYFDRPLEMVSGYISPPSFDKANKQVLVKHVHALVLRHAAQRRETFVAFAHRLPEHLPALIAEARTVFGDDFDVEGYLRDEFPSFVADTLVPWVEQAAQGPLQLFYETGVFPDYGFRRDEVAVLDIQMARERCIDLEKAERRHDRQAFDQFRVTGRDPEQAYYKLHPDCTVFMGGEAFTIRRDSPFFKVIEEADGREVRSYRYLYGDRADDPSRDKEVARYERSIAVTPGDDPLAKELGGLLRVGYLDDAKLSFRNLGIMREGEVERTGPIFGYDLVRRAIVFEIPASLCDKSRIPVSLLSALDRSIKDHYGLDEGDLRLLLNVPPVRLNLSQQAPREGGSDWENVFCAILYDADGNGNVPLRRVYDELQQASGALHHAYRSLSNCPNENCDKGCYLCLRSYSTHYYAADVDKATARMIIGYLLGMNRFAPDLPPPEPSSSGHVDLVLEVDVRDNQVAVETLEKTYSVEVGASQNEALFKVLACIVAEQPSEGQQSLRIVARPSVGYLVDFINQSKLGKSAGSPEKQIFARLLFELLRFSEVHAIAYEDL